MNRIIRSSLLGFALLFAMGVLFACGDKEGEGAKVRTREAMPFLRIRLRNTSPPEAPPSRAKVVGTKQGGPGQTNEVGPVPPGEEQESQPPGENAADTVSITVTPEGPGPTFRGEGSWPGSHISTVDIECGEPGGGVARVNFATGQPAEEIPLHP